MNVLGIPPLKVLYRVLRGLSRFFSKAATRLEWLLISRELAAIPDLRDIYRTMRRSPEARWSVGEDDVLRLYRLVLRFRPRHILEFGTGIGLSTAAMASALKHSGRSGLPVRLASLKRRRSGQAGRVTTLEQYPRCIEIARSLIPTDLASRIEFVHADAKIFQVLEISKWQWFCGYDWNPPQDARYDFVLVDGPSGWVEDGKLVSLDAGDLFRIVPHLNPGCIVYVDGRRQSAKKFKRYLSRYLDTIEWGSEYAIFRRNNKPLLPAGQSVIHDAKLDGVRDQAPYVTSPGKTA